MCIMRAEFYERTVAQRYEGYRIIAAFAICIVGSPAFNTLYCLFYSRNDAFLSAPDKLHAALCPLILEEKREGTCAAARIPRARPACEPRDKSCRIAHCYCPWPINVAFFFLRNVLIVCNVVDLFSFWRSPDLAIERREREYFREETSSRARTRTH